MRKIKEKVAEKLRERENSRSEASTGRKEKSSESATNTPRRDRPDNEGYTRVLPNTPEFMSLDNKPAWLRGYIEYTTNLGKVPGILPPPIPGQPEPEGGRHSSSAGHLNKEERYYHYELPDKDVPPSGRASLERPPPSQQDPARQQQPSNPELPEKQRGKQRASPPAGESSGKGKERR